MSWQETNAVEERMKLVVEHAEGEDSLVALAGRFGVSRKTAHKWLARYKAQGVAGLEDGSRAPKQHPNALTAEVEALVLALKERWPRWGAPKLLVKIRELLPEAQWPSESSLSRILQRHGLVRPRGRRRARAEGTPLQAYTGPNAIWCADFKGSFRLGDGVICTPLTISDGFSRYLLRCQSLTAGTDGRIVQPLFEVTMREFGVPAAIRTDNGPPFAAVGLGGLSTWGVWVLKLGVRLERSRPGCPQDNGRHERLHRTLKEEAIQPPQASARMQQKAFDRFCREYNEERPHEALSGQTPAAVYTPSAREFPRKIPAVEYPVHWATRQVRTCGAMKWGGREIYVNKALRGERIGLEPMEDGKWLAHFASLPLGLFDERTGAMESLQNQTHRR